jgi:hypothetical protein
MKLFSRLFSRSPRSQGAARPRHSVRPILEGLEDRMVPSGLTSITSNFNGTAIPGNDYLWFSSVAKVQGLGSTPVNLNLTGGSISFSAGGTSYDISVPDAALTLSPSATTATTSFNTSSNSWSTSVPTHFSGNVFLAGVPYAVPAAGLPGGIKNVTWQFTVSSDTQGITVQWQWAAAVYSNFSSDPSQLAVKPVDDSHLTSNSDHAGTPENFNAFVLGGARGGGGSNYTGSYSSTASVQPTFAQSSGSLSGTVFDESTGLGISGVTITLTGCDSSGNPVNWTTTTDCNGFYQFNGLNGGMYTIAEQTPYPYFDDQNQAGSQGGTSNSSANEIVGISLGAGASGQGYNFGNMFTS